MSLISNLIYSLNAIDFVILLLYAAIFFIITYLFQESFVRLSILSDFYIGNHVFYKDRPFYSLFPIFVPFIPFSCFIALASNFSTVLKMNGEKGHT